MDWPFKYKHRSCRFVMPADVKAYNALADKRRGLALLEFEAVRLSMGMSRENAERLLTPEQRKWLIR